MSNPADAPNAESQGPAKTVKLQSSDDEVFVVDRDIAEQSQLIKNMLDDVGDLDENIPLQNVPSKVLKHIIEYCTHHRSDPVALKEYFMEATMRSDDMEAWDEMFMKKDQDMIFEILMAANYLDIRPLIDLGCKTVANMIKGKTVEEIRRIFNITNDFTPEEEEKIRQENEWATAEQL